MFRESDMDSPRLHPSYRNKPVPILQQQSYASRFEDENGTHNTYHTVNEPMPEAVPATWDTYYDPSHPDADWSGLVDRRAQKRHSRDHRSQKTGIVQTEFGMVSEVEKKEFSRLGASGMGPRDNVNLIGGIGSNDPSHWKTSYQSLTEQEGTLRSQLVLQKRQLPRKRIEDPAQSRSMRSYGSGYFEESGGFGFDHSGSGFQSSSTLGSVNSRAPRGSLLSNVGASLLNAVPDMNSIDVTSKSTVYRFEKPRSSIRFG